MSGRRASLTIAAFAAALGVVPACVGTTEGERFPFDAFAAGPADADGALSFTNDRGYAVTLSRASLTVGPVYLDAAAPSGVIDRGTGARFRVPSLFGVRAAHAHGGDAGRVVAEVLSQLTVELTRGEPARFPTRGTAVGEPARALRLMFLPPPGVAPEATKTPQPTLVVEGRATGVDGAGSPVDVAFRGALLLDDTWLGSTAPGTAGYESIVDLRTVSGVRADVHPTDGGSLLLRVDPRALLAGCDFSTLSSNPLDPSDATRRLLVQSRTGAGTDQVMRNLFQNLKKSSGVYAATWQRP